ncbi:stage V sporulation protein AE [Chakrabartyella piscis]|uniref:stage V sporulation protein AE n=1 Tax=Chakrabartyella piscis TaxID=2918914 RepID=UPI002958441B|nr:stage V sporulation protein AE [Chakrabartyella piscis]
MILFLKAFVVGGLICVLGQILMDKTKLTSARILVGFVCLGCLLGGLGIYQPLEEFAGAGATVPLTGFGFRLAEGVMKEVDSAGILGVLTGGMKAAAGGISVVVAAAFIVGLVANPKEK